MRIPTDWGVLVTQILRYRTRRTVARHTGVSETDVYLITAGRLDQPRTSGQADALRRVWRDLYGEVV